MWVSYIEITCIPHRNGNERLVGLYRTMCKSSVQLLRHVGVHGVSMCLTRTHTRAPPPPASPRHDSGRVEGRFGRMSRRLAYARRPGRGILLPVYLILFIDLI